MLSFQLTTPNFKNPKSSSKVGCLGELGQGVGVQSLGLKRLKVLGFGALRIAEI